MHPRMARERKTILKMISLYCHENHYTKRGELCADCRELHDYAMLRLKNCPFQEGKTSCGKCKIHCYNVTMREKIRVVMRFAGPKMILHHPILALGHIFDGLRKDAIFKKKEPKP